MSGFRSQFLKSLTAFSLFNVLSASKGLTILLIIILFCVTDRSKAILLWWFFLFYVLVFNIFVLLAPYVCFRIFD